MHRNSFTIMECMEIKEILRKKFDANANEQRSYRRILRRNYNFFISDFDNYRPNGMTAEDFDGLVESDTIKIIKDID